MKNNTHYIQRNLQQGFALIDVMIAALVLAVGVIAFVNLENLSIQRSQQINYRLQATQSAASFIETLRSDRNMVAWLINNQNDELITQGSVTYTPQCMQGITGSAININRPNSWCTAGGNEISNDLFNQILTNFSNNFQSVAGKAIMCLRAQDAAQIPTQVRIIVVWKNATGGAFNPAVAADCPANYGAAIPNIANIDRTQSDIGYFEVYTRI